MNDLKGTQSLETLKYTKNPENETENDKYSNENTDNEIIMI